MCWEVFQNLGAKNEGMINMRKKLSKFEAKTRHTKTNLIEFLHRDNKEQRKGKEIAKNI